MKKKYSFRALCKSAKDYGFTHILGYNREMADLSDFITRIRPAPSIPRGFYWVGNVTSPVPNITLYGRHGQNLGHYQLIKKESES